MAAGDVHTALEVQGTRAGFITATSGGDAFADVIAEAAQPSAFPKKHLSAVRFRDIAFEFGAGMTRAFLAWLESIGSGPAASKDGAIVTYDTNFREVRRLEFAQARIVEVTFPELDGASRNDARIRLALAPRSTLEKPGSGATAMPPTKIEAWKAANFRLRITGLENVSPFTRVTAVTLTDRPGNARALSNFVSTVAVSRAQPLEAFHRDFVVAGHNDQTREKTAAIELLSPNLAKVLVTLNLRGVGIHSLIRMLAATPGAVEQYAAGMYCEEFGVVFANV